MTYDTNERSVQGAAPIELYTFTVYQTNYLYTTASTNQVVQLREYEAFPLRRSSPKASGEIARNNIEVRARHDFPIAAFFDGSPPSTVVLLAIARIHRTDTVPQPFWNGRVLSCKFEGDFAVFHCENIYTSLRRPGLRRLYGRGCPYVLYGPECQADEELHEQSVVLASVDGNALESGTFDVGSDGRYAGGFVEIELVAGEPIRRGIVSHDGRFVYLTHPIAGLEAGMTVRVLPGCKHNIVDCHNFFDNVDNYGGLAPYLGGKNPFGNNGVF